MSSPFDRTPPGLSDPAWRPMIDGVMVLAAAVDALVKVVAQLVALVDELRRLLETRAS